MSQKIHISLIPEALQNKRESHAVESIVFSTSELLSRIAKCQVLSSGYR